jgi:hypothetical protein
MRAPLFFTLEETIQALRIAAAAREYVRRSEELAELLVKSEKPLDPKIELLTRRSLVTVIGSGQSGGNRSPPSGKKAGHP